MTTIRRLALGAAVVLTVGLALSWPAQLDVVSDVDGRRTADLHRLALDHDWVATAARAVTRLGDPLVLTAVVVVVAVGLALGGDRRSARMLVVVTAVGGLVQSLLKILVGRARPDLDTAFLDPLTHSFPSGHAFDTTMVAGAVAMAVVASPVTTRVSDPRPAAAIAVVLALVVGLTRPVLGVHYLADIVAGWLLGVLWLVCVGPLLRPRTVRRQPAEGTALGVSS